MTKGKVNQAFETTKDKGSVGNNESKGHKDRAKGKEEVNEAGERQERKKEGAMEGCC